MARKPRTTAGRGRRTPVEVDRGANADWTKVRWDMPAYKSPEFMAQLRFAGMTLEHFRTLPVYRFAVQRGLIVNDEWRGRPEGYE